MTKIEEKLISEIAQMRNELRDKTVKYITAGLGLVAGLAWNDAIKSAIEYFFPQDQNSLKAKLIYALIITLIVVILSFYLTRVAKKEKNKLQSN